MPVFKAATDRNVAIANGLVTVQSKKTNYHENLTSKPWTHCYKRQIKIVCIHNQEGFVSKKSQLAVVRAIVWIPVRSPCFTSASVVLPLRHQGGLFLLQCCVSTVILILPLIFQRAGKATSLGRATAVALPLCRNATLIFAVDIKHDGRTEKDGVIFFCSCYNRFLIWNYTFRLKKLSITSSTQIVWIWKEWQTFTSIVWVESHDAQIEILIFIRTGWKSVQQLNNRAV